MRTKLVLIICFCLVVGWVGAALAEEEGFRYDDHGRRDPFWRLVTGTGAIVSYEQDIISSDLVLEGIMTGEGGKNIAIINGRIVESLDRIGMFVVQDIQPDAVILRKGLENVTLKIKKEE